MPSEQTGLELARSLSTVVSTYIENRHSETRDLEQFHKVASPQSAVRLKAMLRIAAVGGLQSLVRPSVHLNHGLCVK
jgi:hypothetical protein